MHIADGVLSAPVLAASGGLAIAGVGIGLYKMDYEKIPRVGMLAATFFVASLIHVPIGPASAHLILNGLMGFLLGWAALPALALALLLQAILFGFGGLTSLGTNTLTMGIPAVVCFYLFARGVKPSTSPRKIFTLGFAAGAVAVLLSALLTGSALYLSGREYTGAVSIILLGHIPVMVIEGFVTGWAAAFLLRVRPEIFIPPLPAVDIDEGGLRNA